MSKEEKIDNILKMTKEIMILSETSEDEIDKLYYQTKVMLKAIKGVLEEEEEDE